MIAPAEILIRQMIDPDDLLNEIPAGIKSLSVIFRHGPESISFLYGDAGVIFIKRLRTGVLGSDNKASSGKRKHGEHNACEEKDAASQLTLSPEPVPSDPSFRFSFRHDAVPPLIEHMIRTHVPVWCI